jgi:hypothetical protein
MYTKYMNIFFVKNKKMNNLFVCVYSVLHSTVHFTANSVQLAAQEARTGHGNSRDQAWRSGRLSFPSPRGGVPVAGVRAHDPVPGALQASGAARPRRHLRVHAAERRQAGRRPAGAVRAPPRRRAGAARRRGPAPRRRVHRRRPARAGRPAQEGLRRPRRAVRRPRCQWRRHRGVLEEARLHRPRLRTELDLASRRGTRGER